VIRSDAALIRHDYPNVASLAIGPGGGYEWERDAAGAVKVIGVHNYAIYVLMQRQTDCPPPGRLYASYEGIGLTFVAPRP
jgi:hypothetical protein